MSNAKAIANIQSQENIATSNPVGEQAAGSVSSGFPATQGNRTTPVSLLARASPGMTSVRLNRVLAFVEANVTEDLYVSKLAAVAGMSPFYFCRAFKQSTGITPHRYVLQRRMEQAKRLLEQRSGHLVDVAHQVGFTDQSQFTRVFHKIVGKTPSEYRKKLPKSS